MGYTVPMNDQEVGWVAGIIEGEGTIECRSNPSKAGTKWHPRLEVVSTDEDVVARLHRMVGGHINGPYAPRARVAGGDHYGTKAIWRWRLSTDAAVVGLMEQIRPLMGERRGAKIDAALLKWRGNPR